MDIVKNKNYKAKLISLPAKWNSFHYVVETEIDELSYKYLYFSEAAPGKPDVNSELNKEGFVIFDGTIFIWKDIV